MTDDPQHPLPRLRPADDDLPARPGRREAHDDRLDLLVIGLGYVGLPLVREACRAGMRVAGLDRSASVVAGLTAGASHVDDLTDGDIAGLLDDGFAATCDPGVLARADAVVICVPTPLAPDGTPDLSAVIAATREVSVRLRPGTLVVLESTTWPGTTDEIVRPILETGSGLVAGDSFHLAFSPERIDPGNTVFTLRNTPKVVGGHTPDCAEAAQRLYRRLCDTVVVARGTREAECAKLLENTYRHINIALVNEMAQFCRQLDIDLWDVIDCAATKPFGFQAFRPGPGVGGHCIPIDPNYLSHRVRTLLGRPFRFVELAQDINASMPGYVVRRIGDLLAGDGLTPDGARVLLLGVTYKPDISDQRETPARPIAEQLIAAGADVAFHDPRVEMFELETGVLTCEDDLEVAASNADVVVVLQAHREYDLPALARLAKRVLDASGTLSPTGTVQRL